jgi:hypothetical protein
MEDIKTYIDLAAYGIAAASVIANLTPNDSDNKIVDMANKILGFLAANFNVKGINNK